MITLYQFQFSHYCEKARWALDYRGLQYKTYNLLPGFHVRTAQKLGAKSTLPFILDGEKLIQGSDRIIDYADQKGSGNRLTPTNPELMSKAFEWERFLEREVGNPLRAWFYYHTLPDRRRALQFLLDGAPWWGKPVFAVIFPVIRSAMLKQMKINAETASQSEKRLVAALERLEGALEKVPFLVDNSFSRADLSACALLFFLRLPGLSEEKVSAMLPEPVHAFRDRYKDHRFYSWVDDMYRHYRDV
jgi:glutathione S-transferase